MKNHQSPSRPANGPRERQSEADEAHLPRSPGRHPQVSVYAESDTDLLLGDHKLVVVGYTHRTASLALRSRFAVPREDLPLLAREFKSLPGVSGCVLLATCNRLEAYLEIRSEAEAEAAFVDLLGGSDLDGRAKLARSLMVRGGKEAARHLFRVASGLDAMVLGDGQILGQVKEAYRMACRHGTAGPISHKAFHMAFRCAKRVRTETGLGDGAQSVAGSAVSLLAREAGGLRGKEFLLVGINEMTEAAGERLAKAGAAAIWLCNRTATRGEELERKLGARRVRWSDLKKCTAQVDAVVTCTGATEPVFTRAELTAIAAGRPGRPLTVVDIAVPPDVEVLGEEEDLRNGAEPHAESSPEPPPMSPSTESSPVHAPRSLEAVPAASAADGSFCVVDLEDVGAYQREIEERRCQATSAGEAIVADLVAAFTTWLQNQSLGPKMERLRAEVEYSLARELQRLPADLSDSERERLTTLGQTLIKRFLGSFRRVAEGE